MGDEAVDFYCEHAVLLGDHYVRKDKSGERESREEEGIRSDKVLVLETSFKQSLCAKKYLN